jgi:hypothetical protein
MPVVAGFRHDIFVSYAHADDGAFAGAARGFVSQLVSDLRNEVGRKVGASLEVWWDRTHLEGNTPVTPEIIQAASESAAIVVIASPAYLRSAWCERERSTFLRALEGRASKGAVFMVTIESLPRAQIPNELRDLTGYEFWKPVPNGQATRPLRAELPADAEPYYNQLCTLGGNLAKYLSTPVAPEAKPDTKPDTKGPAVLLAEVTDDLVQQREEVKSYLEQLGFSVLPKRRYSRDDLALHRQQLRADLDEARVFVQLLGPLPGDKSDHAKGMAWLRYNAAQDAYPGDRIIQWRDPQITLDSVADVDVRELLAQPSVRRCGLQELKQEVAALVQRKPSARSAAQPGAPKCVFVNADLLDRPFATEVSGWLADQGYIVLEPPTATDPKEWREEWASNLNLCESMMLVYGHTKPRWVTQQVLQSSKVLAQRESPLNVLAICVGPPPAESADRDKLAELSLCYRGLEYLRCESGVNADELKRFVGKLETAHAI